jgi:hypothetical protein
MLTIMTSSVDTVSIHLTYNDSGVIVDKDKDKDKDEERIVINVGVPRKVSYPLAVYIILTSLLSWIIILPLWIWWLNLSLIIGWFGYTAWDYYRVRKFIGKRQQ